jgi:hypothetical protein
MCGLPYGAHISVMDMCKLGPISGVGGKMFRLRVAPLESGKKVHVMYV